MPYTILTDDDLPTVLPMAVAVAQIEVALREHAAGTLVAPPRFSVEAGGGALVFTAGAANEAGVAGFRVYPTMTGQFHDSDQIVAVFDSRSGELRGLVLGNRLGAMRTGAIGGAAIKLLAREDARILGVIGAGRQARTQIEAAAAVRPLERVRVFSRTPARREAFAAEMAATTGVPVEAVETAEEAVRGADILICATTSATPVFDPAWLAPGTHVTTVGPKFAGAHEISLDVAARSAVIATDSPAQVEAYADPFFLIGTPDYARMVALSAIATGAQPGRTSADAITLFCSVGLAGTEVLVAQAALERARA